MVVRLKDCLLPPRTLAKIGIVLIFLTLVYFTILSKTVLRTYYGRTGFKSVYSYNRVGDVYVKPLGVRDKIPRILFWPYKNDAMSKSMRRKCLENCHIKCDITFNTSDIENVDAVEFMLTELWTDNWSIGTTKTIDFPSYRRPDQVWIVSNLEPPSNLFGDIRVFNGIFNWTLWYRTDATIYMPYGAHGEKRLTEIAEDKNQFEMLNIFKGKENEIIGVISNCKDDNRRYRFIDTLSKYINMDLYGKCYDKVCGDPNNYSSCNHITQSYKFYLAFENSYCKDYLTEKYWGAITRKQIPIVNWDLKNIDKTIPIPGSFISIHDFNSVQELADYIKKVSANESLYNSYFDWKKKYKIVNQGCTSCMICEKLHKGYRPQVVEDLDGWVRDDVCKKVDNLNHIGTVLSEFLFWKVGI